MHDLRRQALESGKTISRKALSREGSRSGSRLSSARNSRPNSRQNSRQSSRAASRYASEDEDNGSLSDGTAFRFVWSFLVQTHILVATNDVIGHQVPLVPKTDVV